MSKFRKQYDVLIAGAKRRRRRMGVRYEIHHVVPRSFGGSDDPANLVFLSPCEHLVAHWLLTKFLLGTERWKMIRVLETMLPKRHYQLALNTPTKNKILAETLKELRIFSFSRMGDTTRREELAHAGTKVLSCKRKDVAAGVSA